MDTNNPETASTSRRTIIKAGTAAGIVAVGLPGAAAAVSLDGSGAFVATGNFDAPSGVTATPSELVSRAINVSWSAVAGATDYQVKYRVNNSGSPFTVAGEVTAPTTTLQVTNLVAGTEYEFVVVATNGTSTSFDSGSDTATATVLAPGVPTNVSATGQNSSVEVSWAAPTDGGVPTTYEVRWSATDGSGWTEITGILNSTFSQTVSGLTNGTTYYFQVRSVNSAGASAWSSSVSAVPAASAETQIAEPPAPQPPVVGATTTTTSVTVYTDSATTPSWTYAYSTNNGENWTTVPLDASTTTFTVSGITASSQAIKVRKVDGATTATSTVTLTRQTPTYTSGQVYSIANPDSAYGVRGITFTLKGGTGGKGGNDGGNSGGNGGKPGVVAGTFTLGSNETLFIAPGSGGAGGTTGDWNANRGGLGGTNALTGYAGGRGGSVGNTGSSGGGGGGGAASVLRKGTTGSVTSATATTIVVAGGGGGGGGADSYNGSGAGNGATSTTGSESGTSGGNGASPPNGGRDDGGGGGGGGGGAFGGWGAGASNYASSGSFTKTYYYRGNGGYRGTNAIDGSVTVTTDALDSASLVNSANGTASFDYLAVTWASDGV
jgi:hypothetical protein